MLKLLLGALACALSLSACVKSGDQPGAAEARGQLIVATQRSPNTLNPVLSANTTEGFLNRLTFDTLVSIAGDGKTIVPILATEVPTTQNGGISKDGLTITYPSATTTSDRLTRRTTRRSYSISNASSRPS